MVSLLRLFDSHGEFRGEFVDGCERHGIVTYRISREGPWQAGHTERHGGVWQETYERACMHHLPTCDEDTREMIACVNNAKDSLAQKGNYSPEILAFGKQAVHVPRATDVDDHNMIVPMSRAIEWDKQMERMMKIQCTARTAAIEAEKAQAVKMALAGKPRKDTVQNFKAGDQVFVWRRVRGTGKSNPYAHWSGPGLVVGTEGRSTVWVNLHGYLVKAPPELVRHATTEESLAEAKFFGARVLV